MSSSFLFMRAANHSFITAFILEYEIIYYDIHVVIHTRYGTATQQPW